MVIKIPTFHNYVNRKMGMSAFRSLNNKEKREVYLKWKYGFSNMSTNESLFVTDRYIVNRVKDMVIDPKFISANTKEGKQSSFLRYMREKVRFQEYAESVLSDIETGSVY